jgi:hypothetical protein
MGLPLAVLPCVFFLAIVGLREQAAVLGAHPHGAGGELGAVVAHDCDDLEQLGVGGRAEV